MDVLNLNLNTKNKEVDEIMKNIAHQWRQPLSRINSIVIGIDSLLEQKGIYDEEIDDKLSEIERVVQYMSNTIDDLKNVKCNEDRNKLFNLSDITNELSALLLTSLKQKEIELRIEVDETIEYNGDSSKLLQVLIIVVNNAKDILIERNIFNARIDILIKKDISNYLIQISDNGGGMTSKTMQKIFNRDFTTKHNSEGCGIGLNMAKKIIEEDLGGELSVKNSGKGTSFEIKL